MYIKIAAELAAWECKIPSSVVVLGKFRRFHFLTYSYPLH